MNPKRRIAIVALFLTTALIGAGAIYIGSRLSSQPEITPDDAAAETQGFGVSFNFIEDTGGQWRWSSYGHRTTCTDGSPFSNVQFGAYHCRGTGSAACTTTSADYEGTLAFDEGITLTCRQGPMTEIWTHDSRACGRVQIDLGLPGGGGIFGGTVRSAGSDCGTSVTPPQDTSVPDVTPTTAIPTTTSTPTPTTIPFDIQVLAFCQDGTGPRYLIGGAELVIVDKDRNPTEPIPPQTNDNGAYTTVKQEDGPYVGHVRISGNSDITLKNQTTGLVERTVNISALTKLTVTGNSTGLAPQCNSSGNNVAGQCTCTGQYEFCNFHPDGANANNRFYFEFKFTNCLATATGTPTPTPVPGEISCGTVCVPGSSICAAGTVCSNVEGTYRCALQTCIDNPGACADICSFEKLPQTALISDEADRIILAVILVLIGGLAIRFGMNERIGDLFWSMGGKYVLSKVHPAYARELKVETKKKVQSRRKQERKKFEKNF